jgi:hypothetical protein
LNDPDGEEEKAFEESLGSADSNNEMRMLEDEAGEAQDSETTDTSADDIDTVE